MKQEGGKCDLCDEGRIDFWAPNDPTITSAEKGRCRNHDLIKYLWIEIAPCSLDFAFTNYHTVVYKCAEESFAWPTPRTWSKHSARTWIIIEWCADENLDCDKNIRPIPKSRIATTIVQTIATKHIRPIDTSRITTSIAKNSSLARGPVSSSGGPLGSRAC